MQNKDAQYNDFQYIPMGPMGTTIEARKGDYRIYSYNENPRIIHKLSSDADLYNLPDKIRELSAFKPMPNMFIAEFQVRQPDFSVSIIAQLKGENNMGIHQLYQNLSEQTNYAVLDQIPDNIYLQLKFRDTKSYSIHFILTLQERHDETLSVLVARLISKLHYIVHTLKVPEETKDNPTINLLQTTVKNPSVRLDKLFKSVAQFYKHIRMDYMKIPGYEMQWPICFEEKHGDRDSSTINLYPGKETLNAEYKVLDIQPHSSGIIRDGVLYPNQEAQADS